MIERARKIKEYFNFNKAERNGIIILCILILILVLLPFAIPYFLPQKKIVNQFKDYELKLLDSINSLQKDTRGSLKAARKSFSPDYSNTGGSHRSQKIHPFNFNPNHLPEAEWIRMGLSARQTKVIINYESKGGQFRKKEDLRKIYSISPEEYEILAPYIKIPPENKENTSTPLFEYKPKYSENLYVPRKLVVELNQADSTTLVLLRGIGPVFARRIIRFRNILGGFYTKDQLKEVYGFDQEKFDQVVNSVIVDTSLISKININNASLNDLKKHPYFDYYIAKAIIDRRVSKGFYISVDQVREISSIPEDKFQKLRKYLTVN